MSKSPIEVVKAYAVEDPSKSSVWLLQADSPLPRGLDLTAPIGIGAQRATWHRSDGSAISAERVDGQWRLTSGVLASQSAETPQQALVLFTRAVREVDASLLLALLPSAERAHWSKERASSFLLEPSRRMALIALLKGLKSSVPLSHHSADAQQVTVGDVGGQVILQREDDGWKVQDLRPHERFFVLPEASESGE